MKKGISFLLMVTIVFSMFAAMPAACAASNVNQEDLITGVSNPSNATISFTINAPAGTTVSYAVELIPNTRTGSIDTIKGTVKNTGTSKLSKKISVTTKYYSNKYSIKASYSTGPARNRTNYSDTDSATSALKTTVYTSKFIWNDANINKWKNGQRIPIVVTFAITGTVDILVTKGMVSGAVATALSIALFAGNMYSAGTVAETKNITMTPIKGWGYQFKLVPYNGGYTKYLIVLDDRGKVYDTINWGKIGISQISLAAR